MENVTFKIKEDGWGGFYINDQSQQLGEMEISIADGKLTVYHTEVIPEAEGRGLAKRMLEAMVAHARENKLKVVALCPYVAAQFKRHAGDYADIIA